MPAAPHPPPQRALDAGAPGAEARLLLACTGPRPLLPEAPERLPCAGVDWAAFAALATRHAAGPLVHRAFAAAPAAEVPQALRTEMRRHAQVNRLRNQLLVEELLRIAAAARVAGVELVPYKGPVLAQQLYGDIGLRVCSDLDLVTMPAQMDRAAGMMRSLGYRFEPLRGQQARRPAADNLRRWHCYNFRRDRPPLAVDLHARFAPAQFPVSADLSTFAARLGRCTVLGQALPCFGDEDLLVLLAMHAAKDLMWRRLTWFAEIAALVQRLPPAGLARALDTAGEMGCRRLLLLALLLAQRLYGLPAGAGTLGSPRERAGLDALASGTVRRLFGPAPAEPSRLRLHFVIHPALRERPRDRRASYRAGLLALLEPLRPPPAEPAPAGPAAWLRYPRYWAGAAWRRLRRLAAAWPLFTGRS